MRAHRVTDLNFTWNGDLVIGEDGDLKDTTENDILSFKQECQSRLRSDIYEWKIHPHLGAGLIDLVGEPNNRTTAEAGKVKIIAALTKDNFVDARYISVRYMPVGRNHLMYSVQIALPDATGDELVDLSLLVNNEEFSLFFV